MQPPLGARRPNRGGPSNPGIGGQPLVPLLDAFVKSAAQAREQPQQDREDCGRQRSPRKADGGRPDTELLSRGGDDFDQAIPYLSGVLRARPANGPGVLVRHDAQDTVVVNEFAVRLAIADCEACGVEVGVTNELIQALGHQSRALGRVHAADAAMNPDDFLPAVDDGHAFLGSRLHSKGTLREGARGEHTPQDHETCRSDSARSTAHRRVPADSRTIGEQCATLMLEVGPTGVMSEVRQDCPRVVRSVTNMR